jgi:hypothetical protein
VFIAIGLLGACACSSFRGVPLPEVPTQRPAVQVGDRVRVTTRNGERLKFIVTAVDASALRGPDLRVSNREISMLEVQRRVTARQWWCRISPSC